MLSLPIMGLALAMVLAPGLARGLPIDAPRKPFVAILADSRGTEAVDLLTPFAILAERGAVEVRIVAESRAPVPLSPGKARLAPQSTLAELDAERPRGPDVVIVPALDAVEDTDRAAWLRAKREGGARIVSICNGALVLAAAGLLDGRSATVHWYSHDHALKAYPKVGWRRDRRWVSDGKITTTSGISASEPAGLQLLRELAGDDVMRETAHRLNLPEPDPAHDGSDFRVTFRSGLQVTLNRAAFWRHEDVALALAPGFDEHAFGVALDGWSRTYRSTAWATGPDRVVSRHGLVVSPDPASPKTFARTVALPETNAMMATFEAVRDAYGEDTARVVAWQFEHPYGATSAW